MKKYYIGLIVLAALTLGMTVYVIGIGAKAKEDAGTEKSAQAIADKLNTYVSTKDKIPASLDAAGIKDVPGSVSYSKLSEEKYEFCVNYKAEKGYGSADAGNLLTGALVAGMYGGAAGSGLSSTSGGVEPSALYLGYTHKKGKVCQTIKPYISQSFSSTSTQDDYCKPTSQYYTYYKSYCKDGVLTF